MTTDHSQALLLQLAYEMRDDVREIRRRADETSELLADLRERVAVLEARPESGRPSATRDVGLVAGSGALVTALIEAIRHLA